MLTLEKVKVLVLGYLDIDNYIDPIQQTLTFRRSDGSCIVIRVGAKSSQFTVYPKDIDNNIPNRGKNAFGATVTQQVVADIDPKTRQLSNVRHL